MKRTLFIIYCNIIVILVGVAGVGSYLAHTKNYRMSTTDPYEKYEPKIEYVYIEQEPEIVTEYIYVEAEPTFYRNISDSDAWYYKDYVMREAEGESIVGMLWVLYTFENRCEVYGHTPQQEWESPASKTSMFRTGKEPNENCLKAYELFVEGWQPKPLFFCRDGYHNFGTPLCQVGNHYFSTK